MAQEENIRTRLTGKIKTDPCGEVSQNNILHLLSDFHLTVHRVGKHIKMCFPNAVLQKGRGSKETVYRGISLKSSATNYNPHAPPSSLPPWVPPSCQSVPPMAFGPTAASFQSMQPAPPSSLPPWVPPSCQSVPPMAFGPTAASFQSMQPAPPSSLPPWVPPSCQSVPPMAFGPTAASFQSMQNAEVVRLVEENHILKEQLREARQAADILHPVAVDTQLKHEITAICSSTSPLSSTIRTVADIKKFSAEDTAAYIQRHAPTIHRIICNLTTPTFARSSADRSPSIAMLLISTIANHRNHRASGLQTILSLGYLSRTCNDQLLATLNHAGMGVSSRSVWRIISEHADIMRSTPIAKDGEIWAYDNVNIMVKVQQVRQGHRPEMKNWTSRLTVPIRHVPDETLSSEPKGRRRDLHADDFLPSAEDMANIKKRFGSHIRAVLSSAFLSFANHKKPPPQQKSVSASTYRPLQLMGVNEATTTDNIHILLKFASEAGMTSDDCWDQEVIGDQATCKNIRGARRYRQDDVDHLQRLSWAKECPGDFHFLWETGRCICLAYWSSPKNVGSLGHLRDVVDRRGVDSGGKKFNQMDEFLHHTCEAHLIAALLQHLEMESPTEVIAEKTEEELEDLVQSFMDKYIFKRSLGDRVDDSVFQWATSLLHHLMLYTDLRQCIRDEDGPAVVAHWRFWLPTFLGTKRSQYSTEAANHLANLMADWSPKTAYVLTHNRGVNTHSREGHGKPVDMLVEHYNKVLKKVLKSSGGHLTLRHAQDVSLAVPLIDEARRFCDKVFGTRQTVGHSSPSATADIHSMSRKISEGLVYQPTPGRRLFFGKEFDDVVAKGMKRITVDNWLTNFLSKDATEDEDPEDTNARDPDQEVDLPALMDE